MKKRIEILARRMFPSFVHEEYPRMITFTEKVLEYMNQEGGQYDIVSNLLEYNDVDTTLPIFESAFKSQYLANFPDTLAADVDLLVKNVRSFYLNKGTESSYRFLFSALFDSTVNFKYPKFNILRASDGIWYTPTYLVLTDDSNNIPPQLSGGNDYNVNKMIDQFITGTTSGAVAFIDNTVNIGDEGLTYGGNSDVKAVSIVEKEGSFIAGEQILIGDTIVENGDFSQSLSFWNENVELLGAFQSANNQAIITQQIGSIQDLQLTQAVPVNESIQYWLRYSLVSADSAETKVTVGYAPGTDEIYNSTNLGTGPVSTTVLLNPIAAGKTTIYITIHNQMSTAGQKCIYDGISLVKENTANIPLLFIANIAAESGILEGTAQWKDLRGMLSEGDRDNDLEIVLQDNEYYQDFSYEVKSQVSTNRFESIIKDLVHPAGFKLFAKVIPADDFSTYALRESKYDDLVFDVSGTITRSTSGKPFDILFRPQDRIRITDSLFNDGDYIVDTVSATVVTVRPGLSIQAENAVGSLVDISSGVGILDLAGTAEQISYDLETIYTYPLTFAQDLQYEIEYELKLGFGNTWADAEASREADGILISDWASLTIGDFESKATSRFGFIDSVEIDITP